MKRILALSSLTALFTQAQFDYWTGAVKIFLQKFIFYKKGSGVFQKQPENLFFL